MSNYGLSLQIQLNWFNVPASATAQIAGLFYYTSSPRQPACKSSSLLHTPACGRPTLSRHPKLYASDLVRRGGGPSSTSPASKLASLLVFFYIQAEKSSSRRRSEFALHLRVPLSHWYYMFFHH